MTTPSGKPPLDEQPPDGSWDPGHDPARPGGAGAERGVDSETAADNASAEKRPMYGTGVPYGGDDRTEEIDPVAFDAPFASEPRAAPAPARPVASRAVAQRPAAVPAQRPAPLKPLRDFELRPPVTQLVLSDLFDSTPPPTGSMAPPDPAAFSSSRTPAASSGAERLFGRTREVVSLPWSAPRPSTPAQPTPTTPRTGASSSAVTAQSANPLPSSSAAVSSAAVSSAAVSPAAVSPAAKSAPRAAPSGVAAPASSPRNSAAVRSSPVVSSPVVSSPVATSAPLAGGARPSAATTPIPASVDAITPRPASVEATPIPASADVITPLRASVDATTPMPAPVHVITPLRASIDATTLSAPVHVITPLPGSVDAITPLPPSADASTPPAPVVSNVAAGSADVSSRKSSPGVVVALPSIIVGSAEGTAEAERTPSGSTAAPSAMAVDSTPEPSEPFRQRRSVPTLESVGNAASRSASVRHEAVHGPALDEVPRFASEVATSRPPDVVLSPNKVIAPAAPVVARRAPERESRPPQLGIGAPAPTRDAAGQLPSIMLGADVEAEPDILARRAQRAGRATVRIELPVNFGRPGSPLPGPPTPTIVRGAAASSGDFDLPLGRSTLFSAQHKKLLLMLTGALLLITCVFLLRPRTGSLVVTALGPGNRAVNDVQIFIDGKPLCETSPCLIKGLTAGTHKLNASAPGLAAREEQSVDISAGEEAIYNIDLSPAGPELKSGGLRIAAGSVEMTLFVDGKRVGKLPQDVSGLAAGKHWIKLDADNGSAPIEKSVNILPGEMTQVEPTAAKRDKALVTIRLSPDSEGASVTLDDAFLLDFPAELELDPRSAHTLSAVKPGYEDFTMQVQLGEDESEKLIEVALTRLDSADAAKRTKAKAVRKPAAAKASSTNPAGDATLGLLNISSVPPSQIILNGRPLGSTPKTSIPVPGDSLQTIVFVHPKMGRRRAQKFVPAGKERTVSIRF